MQQVAIGLISVALSFVRTLRCSRALFVCTFRLHFSKVIESERFVSFHFPSFFAMPVVIYRFLLFLVGSDLRGHIVELVHFFCRTAEKWYSIALPAWACALWSLFVSYYIASRIGTNLYMRSNLNQLSINAFTRVLYVFVCLYGCVAVCALHNKSVYNVWLDNMSFGHLHIGMT